MYTYDELKKGDKKLQQIEEQQKKIKSELNEIKRGSKKSQNQKIQQKMLKIFIIQDKKLLIYLMVILKSKAICKANKKNT